MTKAYVQLSVTMEIYVRDEEDVEDQVEYTIQEMDYNFNYFTHGIERISDTEIIDSVILRTEKLK